jgi:hypothetical protein
VKRQNDTQIGYRAYIAMLQLFPDDSVRSITKKLGCSTGLFYEWRRGKVPSGMFLARMLELGADIEWILTGRRKSN